mmetsp:Transcript_16064/g.36131  ORF Transcript_16064/g.36131 Transcript_16064/m.36131 type:complete len:369 (-) Transcript_16064:129-1235(-)
MWSPRVLSFFILFPSATARLSPSSHRDAACHFHGSPSSSFTSAGLTAFISSAKIGTETVATRKSRPLHLQFPFSEEKKKEKKVDLATSLRTDFISAALLSNQTPRSSKVCLQIGSEDGRVVIYMPKTIEKIISSSLVPDGALPFGIQRMMKQQLTSRGDFDCKLEYPDQRADDLSATPDESVDVVVSLGAGAQMENVGMDWKKSVDEAARVLKPGGRLLFVERTRLGENDDESYLDYVDSITYVPKKAPVKVPASSNKKRKGKKKMEEAAQTAVEVAENAPEEAEEEVAEPLPLFEVGYDDINLVLVPHIAGVAIKDEDSGKLGPRSSASSPSDDEEFARMLSIFERGSKRRKKKKKKGADDDEEPTN